MTVQFVDGWLKYAVMVVSDDTVPLEGDHPANSYPDAGVAVMVVDPMVSVRLVVDDVNVVPVETEIDCILTDPPAVGDLAIVTVCIDDCVKYAVTVILDVIGMFVGAGDQ